MAIHSVLVVEDNHDVRRMVTASIKTLGEEIEVLDVPSAEEALVVIASQPLDLVVIDIRLPGMSGLEMVSRLRKRKPGTNIILVTGVEDAETRQQVSEAGADAYFFKPIDIQLFLNAVQRCLSSTKTAVKLTLTTSNRGVPVFTSNPAVTKPSKPAAASELVKSEPATTVFERLTELKKQVKAVSAMLVNDAGQILEEAGSAPDIATGSPLLSALMHAFRASLQVSQAMARGTSESLQYFVAPRQCIYVTPVGMNRTLFVVTAGYFGPDKLGMIYHAIHLAVRDLQALLAKEASNPKEEMHPDLPAEAAVDKETLTKVEGIFSRAARASTREHAEGFWENAADGSTVDEVQGKDVLSYEEAQNLGLTPANEDQPA